MRLNVVPQSCMPRVKHLEVEVAYADLTRQYSARFDVPLGTSVRGVIARARLCEHFPEIDLTVNRVGIFGALCELETLVRPGDRVEVYRPLKHDPKTARRLRVSVKKNR